MMKKDEGMSRKMRGNVEISQIASEIIGHPKKRTRNDRYTSSLSSFSLRRRPPGESTTTKPTNSFLQQNHFEIGIIRSTMM